MPNGIKETHPAFGKITVSQPRGGNRPMFGSDVLHSQTVCLEIEEAYREWDLSREWIGGGKRILEIEMTNAQWANFVSSQGNGSGTPITLKWRADQGALPPCPAPKPILDKFDADVSEGITDATKAAKTALTALNLFLAGKKPITKSDLKAVSDCLNTVVREVEANLPFVAEQLHRKMEHQVTEAQIEVEAFAANHIRALGMQALAQGAPKLDMGNPSKEMAQFVDAARVETAELVDKSTSWQPSAAYVGYEYRRNPEGRHELRPMKLTQEDDSVD